MEAKLIKTKTGFYLWKNPLDKSQEILGATVPIMNDNGVDLREHKLSLKNCEAIERGYDLDELAEDFIRDLFGDNKKEIDLSNGIIISFIKGFQKAHELMGDKKFSEDDVISMIEKSRETGLTAQFLILTKQQTEWDVEIVMEDIIHLKNRRGGLANMGKPKLDADECLILKRK